MANTYSLPARDFTGKRPLLSMKFRCVRSTLVYTVLVGRVSIGGNVSSSMGDGGAGEDGVGAAGEIRVRRFVDL